MAGNRTLKLSILADVDNLRKNLDGGSREVQSFGDKISDFGKKAGLAFAAAGAAALAYAGKLAVEGVKAAIEDEAAQAKLATTLKNVTGATSDQIKAVEDQILKTSLLTGKTDDELRPSLDRLLRSTQDVTKAQELQNLALDIAAGTGKDLESVSNALAKAYDGNFGALKRLGVSIDDSVIKSKDFNKVQEILANTFKDQASTQADTFQGKMLRLNTAFAEAKETVGSYILDGITPLVTVLTNNLFPIFQNVNDFISSTLIPTFQAIWDFTKSFFTPIVEGLFEAFKRVRNSVIENQDELEPFLALLNDIWKFAKTFLIPLFTGALKQAFEILGSAASVVFNIFSGIAGAIGRIYSGLKNLIEFIKDNPITEALGNIGSTIINKFGGGKASGGSVNSGTTYLVGEKGPELFTPSATGTIIPNKGLGGGSTINITVNGAIDPISTARQIANILGFEATSSGSFSNLGLSRVV